MTAEHASGHEENEITVGLVQKFTPEERGAFIKDDIHAAGNLVKLMVGIFLLGIVLYLCVNASIIW
jgi:hypothetical protein